MRIEREIGFDRQLKRMLKKHFSKLAYKSAMEALCDQNTDTLQALKITH